jgi:bifunctional enzyme CysN/CysC
VIPLRLFVCGSAQVGKATLMRRLRSAPARRPLAVAETTAAAAEGLGALAAASGADAAIIVVDARLGGEPQAHRHSYLAALLGVRTAVLAVNKLDLVDDAEAAFGAVVASFVAFARAIGLGDVTAVPIAALAGDNVLAPCERWPWYGGPTLLEVLEAAPHAPASAVFRLPVRAVSSDGGEVHGTVASGRVAPGDRVRVQPGGRESSVVRVLVDGVAVEAAVAGAEVTLALADALAPSPGDLLSKAESPAEVADQFEATVVWTSDEPLFPHRAYLPRARHGQQVDATITDLKYKVHVSTLDHLAAKKLELNEIGVCNLALARPIAFDPYVTTATTGGFILIDPATNNTVGAGMLHFALRRAHNIHLQPWMSTRRARRTEGPAAVRAVVHRAVGRGQVDDRQPGREEAVRAGPAHLPARRRQRPARPQQGPRLHRGRPGREHPPRRRGRQADGRRRADRAHGVHLAVPRRARDGPRLVAAGEFVEIHVDTPLEVAEQRDVKGLYRKARRGELQLHRQLHRHRRSPYEAPADAGLTTARGTR